MKSYALQCVQCFHYNTNGHLFLTSVLFEQQRHDRYRPSSYSIFQWDSKVSLNFSNQTLHMQLSLYLLFGLSFGIWKIQNLFFTFLSLFHIFVMAFKTFYCSEKEQKDGVKKRLTMTFYLIFPNCEPTPVWFWQKKTRKRKWNICQKFYCALKILFFM